jgi:hypothetical protein
MGGQAGWLLGVALVAGVAVLVASRLKRADPRTGWLIAVGGAFLTTGVAFSYASGIFHPYYVSLLAPFTAMLVGAGAAELPKHRWLAVAAIAAGVAVELKVLGDNAGSLVWLPPVLITAGVAAAVAVVATRRRAIALAAVTGALLIAPAAWSAQTLGHATNGTFPAGGPQSAGMGMGGVGGGGVRGRGRFGGGGRPPAGGRPGAGGPGGFAPPGNAAGAPGNATGGGRPGGGMFGGDTQSVTEALAYAKAHGGGTVAVSSQNGAGTQVIDGENVVAIGGFSGNESKVTTAWLADAVRSGKVRWVLTGGGAGFNDGRTGSRSVMAAVQNTCKPVNSVDGLYDCQGYADALAASDG